MNSVRRSLIEEKATLDGKIRKMKHYYEHSSANSGVSRSLVSQQIDNMEAYSSILGLRATSAEL